MIQARPVDVSSLPKLVDPTDPPPAGTFVRSVEHGDFGMIALDFTTPADPGVYVQWLDGTWCEIDDEAIFVAPVGTKFELGAEPIGWEVIQTRPYTFTVRM